MLSRCEIVKPWRPASALLQRRRSPHRFGQLDLGQHGLVPARPAHGDELRHVRVPKENDEKTNVSKREIRFGCTGQRAGR
jgi:hypothetical protein